jgi:hypothetical protein
MPGDDGQTIAFLDFRVSGTGLAAHEGRSVRLVTHNLHDDDRVFGTAEVTIVAGQFEASWLNGYQRWEYQPVDYYIDVDDSGTCTPGVDLGERFISSAWNPVGDEPLDQDITLFPPQPVTTDVCQAIDRCHGDPQ